MAWKMNPASSFSSISYRDNDDFYHPTGHRRVASVNAIRVINQALTTTKTETRQSNEHKIP